MLTADGERCILTWEEWDKLNSDLALAHLDLGRMKAALDEIADCDCHAAETAKKALGREGSDG